MKVDKIEKTILRNIRSSQRELLLVGAKIHMPTENIYSEIRQTILEARHHVYTAVNSAMVQTYWNIGRIIVEHEQEGKERAEYGTGLLKNLAQRLTDEFGRGFTERNLRNMRTFIKNFQNGTQCVPNCHGRIIAYF